MREVARRVALCAALLGAAMGAAVAACDADDSTGAPAGSGDHVTVDNDATVQPQQPKFDGGPDSIFASVDGGAYAAPDAYDPYGACKSCKCPAGDYCFGGGGSYTTLSTCTPTSFGVGCQPIPAACGADASCDCLLTAIGSMGLQCYPVCVQNSLTVYCPHP